MLDHRLLREKPKECEEKLKKRDPEISLVPFLQLDEKRRKILVEEERLKRERNIVSQEIARLKSRGETAAEKIEQMQKVARNIKELAEERRQIEERWTEELINFPNLPGSDVPSGGSEEENVEIKRWGSVPRFSFDFLPHWELGERLDIIDIKRGGKVAGSRFTFLKNEGAHLERALINFFLDYHTQNHGYREIFPPFLVNGESMFGTGQLPKFAEDIYRCAGEDLYLVPTAEVPLTNLYRDEVLPAEELPVKICGYSACFRSEAGAHGRDTRGIIRLHQFNKVELVNFAASHRSFDQLEELTLEAEKMLELLGLPYRRVALCTGDLGFASAFTYDLEVWLPSAGCYREISSCSNFTDFQARRIGVRYRPEPGAKAEFVHTLNGSGLAIGRTVAAIIENFQDEKGHVHMPEVLQPYMGGMEVIARQDR